jgi:N utilization substance protein B
VTSRKEARRTALTLLYQWDLTRQPLASLFEGEIDPFATELATAVIERAEALDERITEASSDWPADPLGVVERAALRMAIVELDQNQVPREVAINEAVALSKRFASQEAARLVNGILGRIIQDIPDTR